MLHRIQDTAAADPVWWQSLPAASLSENGASDRHAIEHFLKCLPPASLKSDSFVSASARRHESPRSDGGR